MLVPDLWAYGELFRTLCASSSTTILPHYRRSSRNKERQMLKKHTGVLLMDEWAAEIDDGQRALFEVQEVFVVSILRSKIEL
jgi:hypothetical protein